VGKNVAVFVDVANIFYAAKAAGVDIDYVTLLKASSAGRDLVRAYAYTGLDPDNENQRNFHDFLRRHGYRVVSKDIRKYGDGKVKANLDIELVIDMMKTARNLDVAIVVSGDGDFAPAIRAVQEMGVRVEVVSFRGNTSSDLMDVADQFTDITQIAKVEKGSSRSGRRVADDDQDLSMTEVPEKQSEGTGERSRGRGGRTRRTTTTTTTTTRGRGRAAAVEAAGADAPMVVLPGEKLSRVAAVAAEPAASDVDLDEAAEIEGESAVAGEQGSDEGGTEESRRRRRRRGGRGRGRGRGREEGALADEGVATAGRVAASDDEGAEQDDEAPAPTPARRPASAFGSVWDSQIGIAASAGAPIVADDEDFEEPAVPEYLIAERRQHDGARRGGGRPVGRGRGGAYAAALDRERFGGGRGSTPSRFAEPAPRDREPGFRRDDRGDRDRGNRQPFRPAPRPAPRSSGDEPWSEVPPEIEAMLRAQLGSRPAPAPRREEPAAMEAAAPAPAPETAAPGAGRARSTTRRTGRKPAESVTADEAAASPVSEPSGTRRRAPARRSRTAAPAEAAESTSSAAPSGEPDGGAEAAPAASRRGTSTRSGSRTASRTSKAPAEGEAAPSEAPKRRTTRRKADPSA
jgi:uncharacterized LabA/DUF88 family protein